MTPLHVAASSGLTDAALLPIRTGEPIDVILQTGGLVVPRPMPFLVRGHPLPPCAT